MFGSHVVSESVANLSTAYHMHVVNPKVSNIVSESLKTL